MFGGQGAPALVAQAVVDRDPICTLEGPTAQDPCLEGDMFNCWARRSRCGMNFNLLEVLTDEVWEVWRTTQVTTGLTGAQCSLVRIYQGA